MKSLLLVLSLIVVTLPIKVYADISLLLHESKGFTQEVTGVGHITVFISDICTDPPLILRQCKMNEKRGVVLSTYPGIGVNTDYKWFAMPAFVYLYGVESAEQIPLYTNSKIRNLLLENNRAKYLSKQIPRSTDDNLPSGRWRDLIATVLDRDLYAFTVKTTPQQDLRFLEKNSESPKGNDFNILTNNCADFSKNVINFYFPDSASRDLINDFGVTTPKAVVRSFKNYAVKKPELLFHIKKYSQIDGTSLRSSEVHNLTETAFKSKKYIALQALTMPTLLPIFSGVYLLSGRRFNVDAAYHKYFLEKIADLNLDKELQKTLGKSKNQKVLVDIDADQTADSSNIFDEKILWQNYRREFSEMLKLAVKERLFVDNREVKSFYSDLETQSEPFYDDNGDLILKVDNYGTETFLGLTRRNILSDNSDVRLAYKLMLAKVEYQLNAPKKNQETLESFQENWQLLKELSKRTANLPPVENPANLRFLTKSNSSRIGNKTLNLVRNITH